MATLPIIDFTSMNSTDPAERRRVASRLRAACLDKGFFYVTGTGVPVAMMRNALAAAASFFALPETVKLGLSKDGSPSGRGYERLRGQRLEAGAQDDLKEGFVVGTDLPADDPRGVAGWPQYGSNVWPQGLPGWRGRVEAYHAAMVSLAGTIMRALALSLDVAEDHFEDCCRDSIASLRMLHYPPQPDDAPPEARGAGAHSDWGAITILLQDDAGGLQVRDGAGGWIDAPPIEGSFIVNLGDLVPRWTNGLYRSTVHRVINRSGRERYSLAFFFDGRGDYVSETIPTCLEPGEVPKFPPLSVNAHLAEMFRITRAA